MKKIVFTPKDARWHDFQMSLTRHLNVREDPDDPTLCLDDCDGSFRLTRNILANRYIDVDVQGTLDYFRQMGWGCDCDLEYQSPYNSMNGENLTESERMML